MTPAWWLFGLFGGGVNDNRAQPQLSEGSIFLKIGEVKDGKSELLYSSNGLEVLQNLNGLSLPSRRGNS